MDNKKIVGSIKNLCRTNEMTVGQLEKEIGLSQGLISKWMYTTPSLEKIVDIAKYFHVSLDDVVGYDNGIDDEFLSTLINRTEKQIILWNNYNDETSESPKLYHMETPSPIDFVDDSDFLEYIQSLNEQSYYYKFENGYIIIHGVYFYQNIFNPNELELFIQPTYESELILQNYDSKQLVQLWLKILYNLDDSSPDEVKAENLKNDFINSETNSL